MINIRRDVQDPFYRYKMPKIQSKIEGKGNGIKTLIPNLRDIARCLHRPPAYVTKFFGYELGAQTKIDTQKDRYIVNGSHDSQKLQSTLDGFIGRFVLCADCMNPETDLQVTAGSGDIVRNCKACGARTGVEMRHKLCAFIVKNPPEQSTQAGARYQQQKQQSEKSADAQSDGELQDGEENGDGESDSEGLLDKKMRAEAAMLPKDSEIKSQLDDWSVDTSQEAAAQRHKKMANLNERIATKLTVGEDGNEDDETGDAGDDVLEKFAAFVDPNGTGTTSHSTQEIMKKIAELSIRHDKAVAVLVQTLLHLEKGKSSTPSDLLQKLKHSHKLFAHMLAVNTRPAKPDEKSQKAFLGGLERTVGVVYPHLIAKFAVILKQVYDMDLIDEELLLAWGKKPSKKYVPKETSKELRKKAEPFLKWLEEADEESSDEDDE